MKWALLTLLTLALGSLACIVQVQPVPTQIPTSIRTVLTPTPNALVTPMIAEVKRPVVNVRDTAGGNPTGVYLVAGDTVTILFCSGVWCKIAEPSGWVYRGCLDLVAGSLKCQAK